MKSKCLDEMTNTFLKIKGNILGHLWRVGGGLSPLLEINKWASNVLRPFLPFTINRIPIRVSRCVFIF